MVARGHRGATGPGGDRPDRKARRAKGKSDPLDSEAAAPAVLSGTATTIPKSRVGQIEAVCALHVAYRGAVKARTQTANQLHSLVLTSPQPLRELLGTTASG